MLMGLITAGSLAGLVMQANAAIPALDVKTICESAKVFDASDATNKTCTASEQSAKDRLKALWPTLTARERSLCIRETDLRLFPSYVAIIACIDVDRDLKKEQSMPLVPVPPQPSLERFMRPYQPKTPAP